MRNENKSKSITGPGSQNVERKSETLKEKNMIKKEMVEVQYCDKCKKERAYHKCEFCKEARCNNYKCKMDFFLPGGFMGTGLNVCKECQEKYKSLIDFYKSHKKLTRKIVEEIDRIKGEQNGQ